MSGKSKNKKHCQHCGEPRATDPHVIEILFKCEKCGRRSIWRQEGLRIHHVEDLSKKKYSLIFLGLFFGGGLICSLVKDFDVNKLTIPNTMTPLALVGLFLFYLYRRSVCQNCVQRRTLKWVSMERIPSGIRHTHRCKSCGHERVEMCNNRGY